ncbi:MAG: DNA repair protein RadC [Desulfobacteraceae bacterium Eth-SRB2]|nr:MAG: DNA repair protein RadC [Desulfobacteraceae bacterium Eth-SRB2]
MKQINLFSVPHDQSAGKFVSIYRVSLIKDKSISFGQRRMNNSQEAQSLIQRLIKTQGQPDREQFCVILLNAKNEIIGLNIVSIGGLSSASVHPREVLKPAILANAAAMVLTHNHPSGDVSPSPEDLAITEKIVQAVNIIGIQVHEHLIISMDDDRYFSFADNGFIKKYYDAIS